MTGKHEDIAAIQDLNAKQQAAALAALAKAEAAKAAAEAARQQGKR